MKETFWMTSRAIKTETERKVQVVDTREFNAILSNPLPPYDVLTGRTVLLVLPYDRAIAAEVRGNEI